MVRGFPQTAPVSPLAAEKIAETLAMPWAAAHHAAAEAIPKNPMKKRVFSFAMHLHKEEMKCIRTVVSGSWNDLRWKIDEGGAQETQIMGRFLPIALFASLELQAACRLRLTFLGLDSDGQSGRSSDCT